MFSIDNKVKVYIDCYFFGVVCFGYDIIYYVVILSRGIASHMNMSGDGRG